LILVGQVCRAVLLRPPVQCDEASAGRFGALRREIGRVLWAPLFTVLRMEMQFYPHRQKEVVAARQRSVELRIVPSAQNQSDVSPWIG
jgi:hypothetical protein